MLWAEKNLAQIWDSSALQGGKWKIAQFYLWKEQIWNCWDKNSMS